MNAILLALTITAAVLLDYFWEPLKDRLQNEARAKRLKLVLGGLLLVFGWAQACIQFVKETGDEQDMGFLKSQLASTQSALSNATKVTVSMQEELTSFRAQNDLDTTYLAEQLLGATSQSEAGRRFSAGNFALFTRREKAAERHFRRTIALDPIHSLAHNNLGILLAARKETNEALTHFKMAWVNNSNNAVAGVNYMRMLAARGETSEAVRIADQIGPHNDFDKGAFETLLSVLAFGNNPKWFPTADAYVKRTDNPSANFLLGCCSNLFRPLTPEQRTNVVDWGTQFTDNEQVAYQQILSLTGK